VDLFGSGHELTGHFAASSLFPALWALCCRVALPSYGHKFMVVLA
jgi:hypothetical protein